MHAVTAGCSSFLASAILACGSRARREQRRQTPDAAKLPAEKGVKACGQPFMFFKLICTSGSRQLDVESQAKLERFEAPRHNRCYLLLTTAGPGTAGAGFVASAVAVSSAELSSEYFVAAPMTAMVVN